MSTEPNQPMGKFVTRYLSSQVKSTNWSNPWTSIHMGTIQPRRRTQRKSKEGYLCAVFVCVVWEVHRPTIADNGDPVAVSCIGVLKGNPRKVACMLCECVKCIRQTIADNIKRDLVNCTNRHWRTIRVIYRYPRPSRISGLFKNCTRGFG